jgi:2-polyprenyl-6-methoxyphenol hydroxylase-like FAD-dependent oxidoreductase
LNYSQGQGTLKSHPRRALVIGGSMSGLFTGNLLRRAGWDVQIFERAPSELAGRGAGIVTYARTRALLSAAGCDPGHDLGVDVMGRKVLDRSGRVLGQRPCAQTLTSWDRVFSLLRDVFPAHDYHLGMELRGIEQGPEGVLASFADGSTAHGSILVGADGFRSAVRALLLPDVRPAYAGYVAWRGLVDEDKLSAATHAAIFDTMAIGLPPGEQFLCYPVAGLNNDLRPGHRRANFVWYRPAGTARELEALLTDATGRVHALGIPPPLVRGELVAALRQAAHDLLAPQFAEIVQRAPQPFLQPIYDVEATRMAIGRAAMLGDAAFLARPHVGIGVTKAAEDALALAAALRSIEPVDVELARFEHARMAINRHATERGRDLGCYLEPDPGTPEHRRKAVQHGTPQAVMAEIALLDFLRSR